MRLVPSIVAASLCIPAVAHASEPRTHDGFSLQFGIGPGYEVLSASGPGGETSIGGIGAGGFVSIGGFVIPNLAVHGSVWFGAVVNPEADLNGETVDLEGTLSLAAIGAGVTYWITPIDIYVSGSLGIAMVSAAENEFDGESESFDPSWGLQLAAGKEFWVAPQFSLGFGVQLAYANVPSGFDEVDSNFMQVNLMFTGTFN